jgi:hypothetical protein
MNTNFDQGNGLQQPTPQTAWRATHWLPTTSPSPNLVGGSSPAAMPPTPTPNPFGQMPGQMPQSNQANQNPPQIDPQYAALQAQIQNQQNAMDQMRQMLEAMQSQQQQPQPPPHFLGGQQAFWTPGAPTTGPIPMTMPPQSPWQREHAEREAAITESEQIKRLARDQLAGSRPPKLQGAANYDQWREAILAESDLWGARSFLLDSRNDQPPQHADQITFARWSARNLGLKSRIELSLSSEVKDMLPLFPEVTSVYLWKRLESMYQTSLAERRLLLLQTFRDITPQGNALAMMRYLENVVFKLHKLGTKAEDIYHDFALLALGDWEKKRFGDIITKWFDSSKKTGQIQNLDITSEVERISTLSPIHGQFKPPTHSRYMPQSTSQKNKNQPAQSANRSIDKSDQPTPPCHYCPPKPNGYLRRHTESECWTLHPQKSPWTRKESNSSSESSQLESQNGGIISAILTPPIEPTK